MDPTGSSQGTISAKDRLGGAILGIVLIVFGAFALTDRYFTNSIHPGSLDLGEYHRYVGMAIICIGGLFVVVSLRRKSPQTPRKEP